MYINKDQQGLQVFQDIIERVWEDPAYKREFISNPQATIESFIGTKLTLPEGVRIVVRDQSDESCTYLNITHKHSQEELMEMELTDEQLETIAGGEGPFIVSYIVGTISIALTAYAIGATHKSN